MEAIGPAIERRGVFSASLQMHQSSNLYNDGFADEVMLRANNYFDTAFRERVGR